MSLKGRVATADPSRRYLVRPDTTERMDFRVKRPGPGLYKVAFTALVPLGEQPQAEGADSALVIRWSAHRFVKVEPLPDKSAH